MLKSSIDPTSNTKDLISPPSKSSLSNNLFETSMTKNQIKDIYKKIGKELNNQVVDIVFHRAKADTHLKLSTFQMELNEYLDIFEHK